MTTLRDAIAKMVVEDFIVDDGSWSNGYEAAYKLADAVLNAIRSHFTGHPERVVDLLRIREVPLGAGCDDAFDPIDPLGDGRQVFWDYLRERKVRIHNSNIVNDALHLASEAVIATALSKGVL